MTPTLARNPWPIVLAGGLIAGTLDIVYAWLFWYVKAGVSAQRILQSVAAGLLGRASATAGGWETAALGLALHMLIACTMAAVYFVVARRLPVLWRRPWIFGALYGLWLYIAMNYIVVPLSAAASGAAQDPLWIALTVAVHVVFIGIPCALAARYAIETESPGGQT